MAGIKPGKYLGRARGKSEHYDISNRERLPFGLSSNNQPQIALDFDLRSEKGEELPGVPPITIAMSLAKNALPFTIERLRVCGWQGKNILDLRGVDSAEALIEVFIQKDQSGRDRLRAEILTGGGAMTFKLKTPIHPSRLDAFAAYVTRGIDAMPPPAPKTNAAPTTEAEEPQGTNDEIPF